MPLRHHDGVFAIPVSLPTEETLIGILRTMKLPLVLSDPQQLDNPVVFVNEAFSKLTGYPCEQVLGRNCRFLQGPETALAALKAVRECVRDERELRIELLNYRRDGTSFWNELLLSPIYDEAGRLKHFLGLQRDITEARGQNDGAHAISAENNTDREMLLQMVAEQNRLSVALRRAEEDSQARARLMAIAGHDLRQPLQAALMLIDLAIELPDPAKNTRRLTQAAEALQRLGKDLESLAKASRIAGAFVLQPATFPIQDLFARLQPDWQLHAEARNVRLRICPSTLHVTSDAAMLSTILGNLVGNALKYTASGGRVLVGCRRRENDAVLEVLDTGSGIASDKLSIIFEEFRRGDTNDVSDGLGLGLSIVKRTAEALGHQLHVVSLLGSGSCFGIRLPLASD